MCGIYGAIYKNASNERKDATAAAAQLHHRGPDEKGVFENENILLGHTRLSIIDLESGKQPLTNACGKLHLVANGEVYNYVEIAKQFPEFSKTALTHSDCEGIFQAYQTRGLTGIEDVFGMFAFALYDETAEQIILCRDRLGIKPLYYCETKEGIFFASEIKALLALLPQTPSVNPQALTHFLLHQFSTGRDTIFEGIHRVLPGEYILIKNGQLSHTQYWDLTKTEAKTLTLTEAESEFDNLFDEVMTQHMRADVPFGLFLSGGIDSSILLAHLSQHYSHPLKTYSIGFSGTTMEDELDAATALAKHFATEHTAFRVSRDELFQRIVHSIWAADDLMRDYAALPTHALSEVAAQDVKIVFSGEGGDEAFAGYRRYAPTFARTLLHSVFKQPHRPNKQWANTAINGTFSDTLKAVNTTTPYVTHWNQASDHWPPMAKRQYVDIKAALTDNLLVKTDRMMMAFGLEGRVPFSDHRLISFGLSLPNEVKYPGNRGKWLLREWARKHLPADHLNKPKRGFYVPVREWLSGHFLDQLGDRLIHNSGIKQWFDIAGVKNILLQHKNGKNFSRELWCLMQFAIWHTLFIEKPGTIPSTQENPLDWM